RLTLACVDLRQVNARFHITRQINNCPSIPKRGKIWVWHGNELSPQHAKLKADPRQWKRGNVVVSGQSLPKNSICLGEALQISKQGAEWNKIFEPTACLRNSPPRNEHRIKISATSLIDAQQSAIGFLPQCVQRRDTREVLSCIGKAMRG